ELIEQRVDAIMGYRKKKWGMSLGRELYNLEELECKVEVFEWSRLTWSKKERCGHFKDQEMDCGTSKQLVGEGPELMRCLDAM
nr:hypothetical protein [Tanacetum cinerariifolium]